MEKQRKNTEITPKHTMSFMPLPHRLGSVPSVAIIRVAARQNAPYLVCSHSVCMKWNVGGERWRRRSVGPRVDSAGTAGSAAASQIACLHHGK